jgi:hypothetical protein
MRSWIIAALFALAGLLLTRTAYAVHLTNEDSVAYWILILDQAGKREVIIAPGEMLWDICYRCDITLEDVDNRRGMSGPSTLLPVGAWTRWGPSI